MYRAAALNSTKSITFTTTAKGGRRAYRLEGFSKFAMPLAEAEYLIATGYAKEVAFK